MTDSSGLRVVCRHSCIKISSRNATFAQPRPTMSTAMLNGVSADLPITSGLSPMYIWMYRNISDASFFTSLLSVRMIGFLIASCTHHTSQHHQQFTHHNNLTATGQRRRFCIRCVGAYLLSGVKTQLTCIQPKLAGWLASLTASTFNRMGLYVWKQIFL